MAGFAKVIAFGNWLRWKIAALELQVNEVAARLDISTQSVGAYCRAATIEDARVSPNILFRIAALLNFPTIEAMDRAWREQPMPPFPKRGAGAPLTVQRVLAWLDEQPIADVEEVLEHAGRLVDRSQGFKGRGFASRAARKKKPGPPEGGSGKS